jgi:uncharacterized pyridoxal phosphate-containing UPF0001 family protein
MLFDCIHSVDRPSLVAALGKAVAATGKSPRCFVQVNVGNEPQKGGCAIPELPLCWRAASMRASNRRTDVYPSR